MEIRLGMTFLLGKKMDFLLGKKMIFLLGKKMNCVGRITASGVAIWTIFELLGGKLINNSTSMLNYCDEPYGGLGIHTNEDRNAWTEVSSIPWPSTAPNTAPGGWALVDF